MTDSEHRRVARIYERYGASAGKQRSWSAGNHGNVAIRAELVDAVSSLAGDALASAAAVLDIGCGSGWWLERLATDAGVSASLYGLELLESRAAAARHRVPAAQITIGDARALPVADGSFDVSTLFTVLSSLATRADAERAVREARRVLRPRGALLIWEPRLTNPLNRNTISVAHGSLRGILAGTEIEARTTTVFPPLARRLGTRTEQLYPVLARVATLHTHRLMCAREPRS
ncbi:MAG: class I SAM-dependent methyltransferase [Solirubrobacteraceae bacterium]